MSEYPTMQEIVNFEINMAGQDNPERAWILSNFDTWHANPYYQGPAVDHPECDPHSRCTAHGCEIDDSDCTEWHCEICGGKAGKYDQPIYWECYAGKDVASFETQWAYDSEIPF